MLSYACLVLSCLALPCLAILSCINHDSLLCGPCCSVDGISSRLSFSSIVSCGPSRHPRPCFLSSCLRRFGCCPILISSFLPFDHRHLRHFCHRQSTDTSLVKSRVLGIILVLEFVGRSRKVEVSTRLLFEGAGWTCQDPRRSSKKGGRLASPATSTLLEQIHQPLLPLGQDRPQLLSPYFSLFDLTVPLSLSVIRGFPHLCPTIQNCQTLEQPLLPAASHPFPHTIFGLHRG